MLFTRSLISAAIPRRGSPAWQAVLALVTCWCSSAVAAIAWHDDLATARRAAEASHRPVLAIFTASWSSSAGMLDRTTLASDEAVALITACFEPVCLDVDAHAETTRRFGITKVPSACILSADGRVLSQFEFPETPAGFVAAAAKGLHAAALTSAGQQAARTADHPISPRGLADLTTETSGPLPGFGSDAQRLPTVREHHNGTSGGPSIAAVAAKVRSLADFAVEDHATIAPESAIAESFRDRPMTQPKPAAEAAESPHAALTDAVATGGPEVTRDDPRPQPQPVADTEALSAEPTTTTPRLVARPPALPGTVSRTPLSIEPAPTTAAVPQTRSAPWLGVPQPGPGVGPASATPSTASPTTGSPAVADTHRPDTPRETDSNTRQAPAGSVAGRPADEKPDESPEKSPASVISVLQKPLAFFTPKPKASRPAPKTPADQTAFPPSASASSEATAASAGPDTLGSMPLGLEGYCPVTLAERGIWVEGRAQWGVRHRGRTYLFPSVEQQKAFLADPDRYAPVLSGDDPVLALDAGKSLPGQRRYGVTYQSRTYLFSSPETRDAFAANPQRYTARAQMAENTVPSDPGLRR